MSVQTELNAIKKIMAAKNPELLTKIKHTDFGNEELAKLFLLIRKFFVDKSEWLGWDVLKSIVTSKCTTQDKSKYLTSLLDQIQERDISGLSEEMLIQEMNEAGRCRSVLDSIKEIALAAERRDLEAVQGLYRTGYEKAFLSDSGASDECNLVNMAGEDVTFNWRTTGIQGIDERNGITTGALVLLCGDTGTGKSTAAHSIGVHQFKKYSSGVMYASWEQGRKEIMARIFSYESDVDLGKIIDDELDIEERHKLRNAKLSLLFQLEDKDVEKFLKENEGVNEELFIKQASAEFKSKENGFFIYDDGPNFDDLLVRMELLRSTKNVELFVVDYLTIIPPGHEHRSLQSWEVYIKMSQQLKNFARKNDVTVIAPLQFDGKEGKIRFSKNILNDADLAIFMSQDKEDVEMNTVTISFGKYRNFKTIKGKPLQSFKLMRSFETAKFREVTF